MDFHDTKQIMSEQFPGASLIHDGGIISRFGVYFDKLTTRHPYYVKFHMRNYFREIKKMVHKMNSVSLVLEHSTVSTTVG